MCGDAPCEAAAPSHESNLLELIELGDPGATPEADSPTEPHGSPDLAEIVALGAGVGAQVVATHSAVLGRAQVV